MGMIQPKALLPGGKIGIVALAGPLEVETVFKGEATLKELGFDVVVAPSCYERKGYLAGMSDRRRAEDLIMMFADDEVDAILCMRGGYGCNRIIPYLKNFKFSKYPKPFVGYSDITYLHIYLNQCHNLITYHGPMLKDLMLKDEVTLQSAKHVIIEAKPVELTDISYYDDTKDSVEGILVGGNLTIICSTLGTPYEIDTKDKILFIEEVNEPVYAIDRLLTQLRYSGKLEDAAGIMIGDFNVFDKKASAKLLKKMLKGLGKPVAYGIESGHCSPLLTLPMGAKVCLNPNEHRVKIG